MITAQSIRRMRVAHGVALCALFAAVACGGGGGGPLPTSTEQPMPVPSSSKFDTIVNQNIGGGWGVEVGIFRHGVAVYTHGYGFRDRGLPDNFFGTNYWGIVQPDVLLGTTRGAFAPDANTDFDLASVSKEFTAAAILLLAQDGKLSVTDPVSKYFPSLPDAGVLTLAELLHHSSGFVDYNNFGVYPDFSTSYLAFMASGQTNYQPIVDQLATFPLDFAPGTAYEYSNTNYLLLGAIVAKVSGEPLGAFLTQRIFGPLGMTHTQQGYPAPGTMDLALGYGDHGSGPQRTWQWNLQWLAGPGGLTSSVGDIELWDRAVRAPGIFSQATLAQMFAPGRFPQSYGTYADGWFISTLSGHLYIWHDGALGGFQTMNATFPNDDTDIIILTNDGSGIDPYFIVPRLFAALTSP
ncbi:MAG: serine hydrolase domain-containing protein [Candidatus Baltobacteraceae bacterium]